MEEMNLESKLQYLRENQLLKCNNKKELLQEHESTWQTNGLASFHRYLKNQPPYYLEERIVLSNYTEKFTVELSLNHHWSDDVCHEQDLQYIPSNDKKK